MEKNEDVKRLRNGCILQVLTNVDVDEIFKMGGIICNLYDGYMHEKIFEESPLKTVIEHLHNLKLLIE